VRYHSGSATLIVDTDVADSNGFVYRVRSALPRFTAESLRAADTTVPEEIAEQYLALPPTTSIMAGQLAEDWTAGAATPYDKALALQAGFQEFFTYDLEAPAGHSPNAIDAFLKSRSGYCEQFAGTYAVMARQLGIPARVAVGFTPGEEIADAPGRYRVRGEHAHAWPEVWLGQYGWVAFEPTPGRGAPGAEDYTGLPEAQDTSGPETSATTQTSVTTATTVAGGVDDPSAPSTTAVEQPGELEPFGSGANQAGRSLAALAVRVVAAVALLAALGLAAVPAATRWQRGRRRRLATTDESRIRLAAAEVAGGLRTIGLGPRPHETAHELAVRVSDARPELVRALRTLAELTDAACFAPPGTAPDPAGAVEQAEAARDEVLDIVARLVPPRRRLLDAFDPRRLVDHHGSARHVVGPGPSRPVIGSGRR
jgi:transglutaminase-like putative cysteine protease